MAVNFEDVKKVINETPLNENELVIIAKVEKHIDKKIMEKFDNNLISFETSVFDFNFNPDNPNQYSWDVFKDIKSTRKKLMTKELIRRYEEAGWWVKLEHGEDDGPNRPAIDYYILKGKL